MEVAGCRRQRSDSGIRGGLQKAGDAREVVGRAKENPPRNMKEKLNGERPISDLAADPKNPRKITDDALLGLGASLRSFGDLSGLVFNRKTGHLVAGHQRLKALVSAGAKSWKIEGDRGIVVHPKTGEKFPVRIVEWDEVTERAANLTANNPEIAGEFTEDAIGQIEEMEEKFPEFEDVGLDDLKGILEEEGFEEMPEGIEDDLEEKEIQVPEIPISKKGDLWLLGKHRILCGDSTKEKDIDRLLDSNTACLLCTSPPYWTGQEYDSKSSIVQIQEFMNEIAHNWAKRFSRRIIIQTGNTSGTLSGNSKGCEKILLDGMWVKAFSSQNWFLRHRRCWAKEHFRGSVAGPESDYVDQAWEVILTFWNPSLPFVGQERIPEDWPMAGIWKDIGGHRKEGEGLIRHPCPYPTVLAVRIVSLYSKKGDLVVDPFMGSGTTLIASERTGRQCYGMELEPRYVDVAIMRWQELSGQEAVNEETHRAFSSASAGGDSPCERPGTRRNVKERHEELHH